MHTSSARRVLTSLAVVAALGAPMVACGSASSTGEDIGSSTAEALTGASAVARAEEWVQAELPYCEAANHQPDSDPSCASTCTRPTNAAWDPYRSDCSGLVSWAWGLPAPGRVTGEFAPDETDISYVIDGTAMEPGDALNCQTEGHIVLFKEWVTPGEEAVFIEEPGCSVSTPYAHEFTSSVSISGSSVAIAYEGKTFTSIRYTGITQGGAPPPTTDAGAPTPTPPTAPPPSSPPSSPSGCYSSTLGRDMPANACVQSESNDDWYQCDDGEWVDRWDDPTACSGVYPR